MDIYAAEPVMLDERALSERSVSADPIREAIGCWNRTDSSRRATPRHCRGPPHQGEIVDMIRAWAALESMAARLITTRAQEDIPRCATSSGISARTACAGASRNIPRPTRLSQALISLSESPCWRHDNDILCMFGYAADIDA